MYVNINITITISITICIVLLSSLALSSELYLKNISIDKPPGRMINIGNNNIHIYCIGEGSPTVLFEAGLGANMLEWSKIHPNISKKTRACVYDRTGYGWSEKGTKPRLISVISSELEKLLYEARELYPYILVGHSFGGLIVQKFQQSYPNLVHSMLLIDSMHPDQFRRFKEEDVGIPSGPARDITFSSKKVLTYGLPKYMKEVAYELASTDKTRSFLFNELRNLELSGQEIKKNNLIDIPVIVLTQGNNQWGSYSKSGSKIEKIWLNLQLQLSKISTKSKFVILEESGHQIHLDDPEKITIAIKSLIDIYHNKNATFDNLDKLLK